MLAWACFETMGYNLGAFGAFLFFFVLLCLLMGWQEAIAMDSVLVSHFLGQGAFFSLLGNEMLLFAVGTGFGILVNLHLRSRRERFTLASDLVDGQIKEILGDMARCLTQDQIEESSCHGAPSGAESSFDTLREALRQAENCAVANYGNAPFSRDTYELDYVRMRQQQSVVLQTVYDNIRGIGYLPKQAGQVAGLPRSREEFEARAVLFYTLKQLEELLEIKKGFLQARQQAYSPAREADKGKEIL